MELMKQLEVWFLVGSQHLYGATTLKQVADHAHTIASQLNEGANLPLKIVLKPTGTTLDEISAVARMPTTTSAAPGSWCGCTPSPPPRCGSRR